MKKIVFLVLVLTVLLSACGHEQTQSDISSPATDTTETTAPPSTEVASETYAEAAAAPDAETEVTHTPEISETAPTTEQTTMEDQTSYLTFVPAYISDQAQIDAFFSYESPVELGSDLSSGIVEISGTLYQMPFPVSELLNNGWELSPDTPNAVVNSLFETILVTKSGVSLSFLVENPLKCDIPVENAIVSDIRFSGENAHALCRLPSGLTLGMTRTDLEAALAETEYEVNKDFPPLSTYKIITAPKNDQNFIRDYISITLDTQNNSIFSIDLFCG